MLLAGDRCEGAANREFGWDLVIKGPTSGPLALETNALGLASDGPRALIGAARIPKGARTLEDTRALLGAALALEGIR